MTTSLCELISTDQPIVMGILNTTPDSFSDGGRFEQIDMAVQHALQMQAEGAQIIDVGGESTRPGAEAVSVGDELQRVIPLIESLRQHSDVIISIDTSKPEVMRAAVAAGANLVNDVTALRAPGALETCAELDVPVCLMHMQGEPRSMQSNPSYRNVVAEVSEFLLQRKQAAMAAGIGEERILLDPGFGFGKSLAHNLQLLKQLEQLQSLGSPLLVGLSRKSMFAAILDGAAVDQRLYASVAAAVLCWDRGARLFRVHDVKATVDALKVCSAMQRA
ncbi:MAG TPA: dihydropteroate synthase [Gammaproteobacteria bacterium]